MKHKAVQITILTLLLASTISLMFNTRIVLAGDTIYIRAEGSIDPPTAPINRVGNVYTFTANIYESIVIEKDNITVNGNGYTLQGTPPTTDSP